MALTVMNPTRAPHYVWGDNCDGWHLLDNDQLSIIQECMPSGKQEKRHYHTHAQQFFYILSGLASIEVAGQNYNVPAGNGIHVPAGEPHQLCNKESRDLHFLVISQPKSHGDRVLV